MAVSTSHVLLTRAQTRMLSPLPQRSMPTSQLILSCVCVLLCIGLGEVAVSTYGDLWSKSRLKRWR